ncbi:MAG: TIGR00701 family protein [Alphaproteobacteria bacterium]|jgi:protoporphyrinogen IX oxidase|nr:TIGR00701 family protein [Alphaproteobacteria bacterium]MBT5389570.1 TIGR00701 family protein [Alphaproteobacteria bacterium]MBT5540527.1 TIGR00701 family protein [Alphaproteobacteria bacterium]MBT5654429.1 TIGR00701 family protein [Alphaproteobacteria bacterium]
MDAFEFLVPYFFWIKALHIILVIFWMAALFYFPRLLVYHVEEIGNPEIVKLLSKMAARLLSFILTPATIGAVFFGVILMLIPGVLAPPSGWFHLKLVLVLALLFSQGYFVRSHKQLLRGEVPFNSKTIRLLNEIPPVLTIFIVLLAVLKFF